MEKGFNADSSDKLGNIVSNLRENTICADHKVIEFVVELKDLVDIRSSI